MVGIETLTGLFFTAVFLALVPGPDNLFVLTQSLALGRRAGLMATLGFCSGLVVHTLAVVLGIAAVIQTSELAFRLLKYAGAGYLLYLAWQFLRAHADQLGARAVVRADAWTLYRRGILMNVTNPKVSLFFLAFLPQFTDPTLGSVFWQLVVFGLLIMLATLLVFGGLALLADAISPWLNRTPDVQLWIYRLAALIFVLLALRLAMTEPV